MRKNCKAINLVIVLMLMTAGCGRNTDKVKEREVLVMEDLNANGADEQTQVIVRDDPVTTGMEDVPAEMETTPEAETETVIAYADRIAGDNVVSYNIEMAVYEDGVVSIAYPQLTDMTDTQKQQLINEHIKKAAVDTIAVENLLSYELRCETATKGDGLVSFIFRGSEYYANAAYPNNLIKTLNIDLNTGKSVRLKDFSDIASVVSSLELAQGYTIKNEAVDMADFSAYLNNGAVTDYAITLLDYDVDFESPAMVPAGFSAIRDNHLILFMKAEHAMGDYVELEFLANL